MKNFRILFILILGLSTYSCTDDDDSVTPGTKVTPNEEELITTVQLIFSNEFNVILDSASFNDPDGDGGNAPSIDTITLQSGTDYTVDLKFLDASDANDVEDITIEIEEEDDEHLICFDQSNISGLTINRSDSDGTYEIGLKSLWVVDSNASSNSGVLKLTLKHQPGSKDGTCAPGDIDVEIDFPVIIN